MPGIMDNPDHELVLKFKKSYFFSDVLKPDESVFLLFLKYTLLFFILENVT